jgi:uncharacterized protein YndB with AHSA1/START domain
MSVEARGCFRADYAFTASAERVFDAWLDAEKAAAWLFTSLGERVTQAAIDPRVGGSIRFVTHRDGQETEHSGEFLEIQRPYRLCLTIRSSVSAATERVTVRIEPRGAGCFLTLTSRIEPAPLQALAPLAGLETYRTQKAVRSHWPTLPGKAAVSLGLHLAMLPLLPIFLREPTAAWGPPPGPAMMTVDIATAGGATLPEGSHLRAATDAPPPTAARAPRVPARQAPHATASRTTLPLPPSRTPRPADRTDTGQGASASVPAPHSPDALGGPPHATGGAGLMASAQVEPALVGTLCIGTVVFSANGGVVQARGTATGGRTFYAGQTVPAEARFFQDRDGKPWIRFALSPGAPWDLPVTVAGSEIRWTDVDGGGYALRPVGNNHLTGVAGFSTEPAAKIDFTCAGSDAHPT